MTIYAEVRKWNDQWGVVQSVIDMGAHVPDAAPPLYFIDVAGYTPAPVQGEAWWYDHQADAFTNADPGLTFPKQKVDPEHFWFERITDDERGKIFALAQEDAGGVVLTVVQRGRLKALLAFTTANEFQLDHPEVVYIIHALETAGAIGPDRAWQILNEPDPNA